MTARPRKAPGELGPFPSGESSSRKNVDAVLAHLRQAILEGDLVPGQEISQVQLASTLGVSRTPLREALRMLQQEGLIDAEPHRRVRVAEFSLADCEDLYVMRMVLEGAALRVSADTLTPEDLADLEGMLAQMGHFAAAEDYERWEVPHRAFHRLLVSRAGQRIDSCVTELSDHANRYRRLYTVSVPRAWSHGADEHRQIVDAVQASDSELAANRLVAHLARTALSVVTLIDPTYKPHALEHTLTKLVGENPDAVWSE